MAGLLPSAFTSSMIATCICVLALASDGAAAQSLQVLERPSTQLSQPANVEVAVALGDGSILLGGSFDLVQREFREGLARLDASGALDASSDPQCRDSRNIVAYTVSRCRIQAMLALPDGSVLVAGAFNTMGGLARGSLARLRPDGQFDPGWAASQLSPERIAELDQTPAGVVVGTQNGTERTHFRISPITGAIDASFAPLTGVHSWVVDMRGRSFVWRAEADRLVRLTAGESAVDSGWRSGLPAEFAISSLVYHAGVDRLFAAVSRVIPDGSGGSTTEHRVVRFDPQAAVGFEADWEIDFEDSGLGAREILNSVSGLLPGADARLYLSPGFGNAAARGIIAVDAATGAVMAGVAPGGGSTDRFRALHDAGSAGLLVASDNADAEGSISPGGSALARLRADLSLDTAFTSRVRNIGSARGALVAADGAVVVHGEFSRVDDQRISSIFRLRPDLTLDQQWVPFARAAGPGLPTPANSFWALAADDTGRVHLSRSTSGGIFPPGWELAQFQRFDRNSGQLDSGWSWFAYGTVFAAAFDSAGRLYTGHAGGLSGCSFNVGLLARVRVDAPCAIDSNWRPALSGFSVGSIVPDEERFVYALGTFAGIATDGAPVNNLARISTGARAQIDPSWLPQPTDASGKPASVGSIVLHGNVVYAGGSFARIAGQPWRGIARLSTANAELDTGWNAGDDQIAYALTVDGNGLLYSIDQPQPFGLRRRVVLRDTEGAGLPLAILDLQGPQPDARDVVALPQGGAIVVGRFAVVDGRVRTGLMAIGPARLDLFSDSFEAASAAQL